MVNITNLITHCECYRSIGGNATERTPQEGNGWSGTEELSVVSCCFFVCFRLISQHHVANITGSHVCWCPRKRESVCCGARHVLRCVFCQLLSLAAFFFSSPPLPPPHFQSSWLTVTLAFSSPGSPQLWAVKCLQAVFFPLRTSKFSPGAWFMHKRLLDLWCHTCTWMEHDRKIHYIIISTTNKQRLNWLIR